MSIIEALQTRNPNHDIDVEEDFDPYKQHYRYFLRVDDRRTSILYSRGELLHHTVNQHSGKLIYTALVTHIGRALGLELQ
jgi:hypothetical protein